MERRTLLRSAAAGAGVAALQPWAASAAGALPEAPAAPATPPGDVLGSGRRATGRELRRASMERAFGQPLPVQRGNGEETSLPYYMAAYAKGLPHSRLGEVDPAAYRLWRRALSSGRSADFAKVPLGVTPNRKQLDPQGGLAFNLFGPDPHGVVVPNAPGVGSARIAAEMAELYWMALLRDVPFADYETSPLVAEACADLSTYADHQVPTVDGRVTPGTLFRGNTPGDLVGPFMSQFLLQDVQYGTTRIPHRHDTVAPGVEYGTDFGEYVALQQGAVRTTQRDFAHTRYIQSGRDMGHYTHFDLLYQPYLYACLILLGTPGYPAQSQDKGNPYLQSANQVGFCSFGMPHIMTLLAEVGSLAIKHTLYHQFFVHRRLRPEAMAARIHVQRAAQPGRYDGLIHDAILESAVLERVRDRYGSDLLPLGFPEGSPMSPAYQSGHCTVAGAGVTILKAWFDESFVLPNPVVPDADGTALVPYDGPPLTIGGELNKLAANIGAGRAFGGVHYRSDNMEGYLAGEAIALAVLRDQKDNYNERHTFSVTRFDGTTVTI